MFYLETKDGERFLTSAISDDKSEFENIIESKMGRQAVELFNDIVDDAREEGEESVSFEDYVSRDEVYYLSSDLADVIKQLKIIVDSGNDIDKSDIEIYLEELKDIHTKLENL
jgi:hypothetical protein